MNTTNTVHTVYLNGAPIFEGELDACIDLYESPATELNEPGDSCSVRDADDMTVCKAIVDGIGRHLEVVSRQ